MRLVAVLFDQAAVAGAEGMGSDAEFKNVIGLRNRAPKKCRGRDVVNGLRAPDSVRAGAILF